MATGTPESNRLVQQTLRVSVPASSANIGPGFDVLGMALSLYAHLEVDSMSGAQSNLDNSHPAMVAYRRAGGRGSLQVKCSIPSGRGLGFSGAVRVGGVCLGLADAAGIGADDLPAFIEDQRQMILDLSAELEGHADNVAASVFGGVTAVIPQDAGHHQTVGLPLSPQLQSRCTIAVWVPSFETSTAKSRQTLPAHIDRVDAVFTLAHAIRLTVALAEFDIAGLRSSLFDRLHQDSRLQAAPLSHKALTTMLDAGAITGWLSGSGPTVAALCWSEQVGALEQALDADDNLKDRGRVLRLSIDVGGLQAAR